MSLGTETDASARLAGDRVHVDGALSAVVERHLAGVPEALAAPMRYALATAGKRLRPVLCAAAYRAVRPGDAPGAVYRLGCALEIVHTYSLVHDDLPCMDDDDLRRGRPTLHRAHGVPAAVVAGAALLPMAVEVLLEAGAALGLDGRARGRLASELLGAAGAGGMVGGQWLDLAAERRETGPEALEAIHRGKTGALLVASVRLGARAAGATEERLAALTAYAAALGLAFQITDDVLDVVGDAAALGKAAGRDEALRKASYPSLHGIDGARRLARARADEARAALRGIDAPDLLALADFVVERER